MDLHTSIGVDGGWFYLFFWGRADTGVAAVQEEIYRERNTCSKILEDKTKILTCTRRPVGMDAVEYNLESPGNPRTWL